MKRIRVTVTQEDIDKGQPGDCVRCPLAYAIARRFDRQDVAVENDDYWVGGKRARLSDTAYDFVYQFDAQFPVKPATFLLPVPE